jgi:hypothetical protein
MKIRFVLLAVLLLVSSAFALTEVQDVTLDSTEEMGMTVQAKRMKDGTYEFTVTRFLTTELKHYPGAEIGDVIFEDSADLEIRGGDKLLGKTRVAPDKKGANLVYSFILARDCIAPSRFAVVETVRFKEDKWPRPLGRVMFDVNLADIDKRLTATAPQHP